MEVKGKGKGRLVEMIVYHSKPFRLNVNDAMTIIEVLERVATKPFSWSVQDIEEEKEETR